MLQHTKVIVVNKFSNLEVKIQSLVQLLQELPADSSSLTDKQLELYHLLKHVEIAS